LWFALMLNPERGLEIGIAVRYVDRYRGYSEQSANDSSDLDFAFMNAGRDDRRFGDRDGSGRGYRLDDHLD